MAPLAVSVSGRARACPFTSIGVRGIVARRACRRIVFMLLAVTTLIVSPLLSGPHRSSQAAVAAPMTGHHSTLACDCPWSLMCEADLFAGMVFDAGCPDHSHPKAAGRPSRRGGKVKRRVMMTAAAAVLPSSVIGQHTATRAFQLPAVVPTQEYLFDLPTTTHSGSRSKAGTGTVPLALGWSFIKRCSGSALPRDSRRA